MESVWKWRCRFVAISLVVIAVAGCSRYEIKQSKVQWVNVTEGGTFITVLEGADPETFRILKHRKYGKDHKNAYFEGQKIEVADIDSFRSIDTFYAVDDIQAYHGAWVIKGSHVPSFRVLQGGWSRDRNDIYYQGLGLHVCDASTFQMRGRFSDWGIDSECAYWHWKRIPIRDRTSFVILDGPFSKDRFAVYWEERVVEGADPKTFEMIPDTYVGRDKYGCYTFVKRQQCPE